MCDPGAVRRLRAALALRAMPTCSWWRRRRERVQGVPRHGAADADHPPASLHKPSGLVAIKIALTPHPPPSAVQLNRRTEGWHLVGTHLCDVDFATGKRIRRFNDAGDEVRRAAWRHSSAGAAGLSSRQGLTLSAGELTGEGDAGAFGTACTIWALMPRNRPDSREG